MAINFESALGIHAEALRVRSQRAELLATNLANADTPNFKARDIDFQTALQAATAQQSTNKMQVTHHKHIQMAQGAAGSEHVQYRTIQQDSLDGNSVDAQVEQAQFMQNAIQYQVSLEFLGSRFQGLTKALRGD